VLNEFPGQVEKATGKGNGKAPAKTAIPEPAPMEIEEASHPKAEDKSKQSQGTQEVDLEEKRRLECLDNMEKIEKEFSILKEKFYSDKIAHLKAEIDKILEGAFLCGKLHHRDPVLNSHRKARKVLAEAEGS
jgi:hypothetical protein